MIGADGSRLRAVTRDSDLEHVYNTLPLWISPREIVFHRVEANGPRDELWVVDVETGDLRRLVAEADTNYSLQLQPHGSLLVYGVVSADALGRAIVDVRTGERRLLPGVHGAVAWSHDGAWLAYGVTGGPGGLYVMRPDGTGSRTLVSGHYVEALSWSPDDSRLAFVVVQPLGTSTRYGQPVVRQLYSVAADGNDLRQLTGVAGDGLNDTGGRVGVAPVPPQWWPDGSRLFFRDRANDEDAPGNWTTNADGSCEVQWARPLVTSASPRWRPGTVLALGPNDCTSVIVRLRTGTEGITGLRGRLMTLTVRNDGTQPLRNLRVTLSATRGTLILPDQCHGLVCDLGTLRADDEAQMEVWANSTTAGDVIVDAAASYDGGPDAFPRDDKATAVARVLLPCDILGTARADRLVGTQHRDRICGQSGDDRIDAKAGNDHIDAGPGQDTVFAGLGRDIVSGGGGADVIVVADGESDVVDCGTEVDRVIADRKDVVHRCERVRRRARRLAMRGQQGGNKTHRDSPKSPSA